MEPFVATLIGAAGAALLALLVWGSIVAWRRRCTYCPEKAACRAGARVDCPNEAFFARARGES